MTNNIRVNDIPLNERPMEKLLQFGVDTLSNEELLAILLRTGTKGENVIALSSRLLAELDGLDGLLNVSYEEASKIKGIKNTVFYSNPLDSDKEGIDYNFTGYVNKNYLKDNVNLDSDFYLCGPPVFMKAVESTLLELGVDSSKINYELFSK